MIVGGGRQKKGKVLTNCFIHQLQVIALIACRGLAVSEVQFPDSSWNAGFSG